MPQDLLRNRFGGRSFGPTDEQAAADVAAIDRGESRTVYCSFRGFYGAYPRRFWGYHLDLRPGGLVLRPRLKLGRRFHVGEQVLSAHVRPFESKREAMQHLGTGQYAPGGKLEWAGMVVVRCETSDGVLEFAVPRPDVRLVLHYLDRLRQAGSIGDES